METWVIKRGARSLDRGLFPGTLRGAASNQARKARFRRSQEHKEGSSSSPPTHPPVYNMTWKMGLPKKPLKKDSVHQKPYIV